MVTDSRKKLLFFSQLIVSIVLEVEIEAAQKFFLYSLKHGSQQY